MDFSHGTRRAAPTKTRRTSSRALRVASVAGLAALLVGGPLSSSAFAAEAPVGLGTAKAFAVLAGQTVTNTGPSVVNGDLGISPGTAFVKGPMTLNGVEHLADGVAGIAQNNLTTAYDDAAGRAPTSIEPAEFGGGKTFLPGVYDTAASLDVNGQMNLDAGGDPNAVFIFRAPSTLVTGADSQVNLVNGARACNVFWKVSSSATLGTRTDFVGTIMAFTSITLNNRADIEGRALARNGAVTMDNNTITAPNCATVAPPPTSTPTPTPGPGDDGTDDDDDTTDNAGLGGTGGTGGTDGTGGNGGSDGTGGTGGSDGSGGSGAGDLDKTVTQQVSDVPNGSVDTGLAADVGSDNSRNAVLTGAALVMVTGLGAVTLIRRRRES